MNIYAGIICIIILWLFIDTARIIRKAWKHRKPKAVHLTDDEKDRLAVKNGKSKFPHRDNYGVYGQKGIAGYNRYGVGYDTNCGVAYRTCNFVPQRALIPLLKSMLNEL